MEALALKLTRAVRPVELEDEAGNVTKYELREMKASDRDKYMTQFANRCVRTKTGDIGALEKFDGHEAEIITRCLFKEDGTSVKIDEIQKWPSTSVTTIAKAALELNAIKRKVEQVEGEEPGEPEAKND